MPSGGLFIAFLYFFAPMSFAARSGTKKYEWKRLSEAVERATSSSRPAASSAATPRKYCAKNMTPAAAQSRQRARAIVTFCAPPLSSSRPSARSRPRAAIDRRRCRHHSLGLPTASRVRCGERSDPSKRRMCIPPMSVKDFTSLARAFLSSEIVATTSDR